MQDGAINGAVSLQSVDRMEEELTKLREDLQSTVQAQAESYFQLAALLTRAFELSAHRAWDYPTWEEYIDQEIGMGIRKVQYLMNIHHWFVNVIKSQGVIKKVQGLGWTKVRMLSGVVDETNVDEWVERAREMTCSQLEEFIKGLRNEQSDGSPGSEGSSSGSGTEASEKPESVNFKLFPEQKQALDDAMTVAKQIAESDKPGNCLALICGDFTASNRFNIQPGQRMMSHYLQRISDQLGVNLVASYRSSGEIITGKGHIVGNAAMLNKQDRRELIVGLTNEEGFELLAKKERKAIYDQLAAEFSE